MTPEPCDTRSTRTPCASASSSTARSTPGPSTLAISKWYLRPSPKRPADSGACRAGGSSPTAASMAAWRPRRPSGVSEALAIAPV